MYSSNPNISQAKFLVRELLATLGLLENNDYDEELRELIEELQVALF